MFEFYWNSKNSILKTIKTVEGLYSDSDVKRKTVFWHNFYFADMNVKLYLTLTVFISIPQKVPQSGWPSLLCIKFDLHCAPEWCQKLKLYYGTMISKLNL